MSITHSQQFLRKRKFMLLLPLLTLPFLTLAFWAMGGGQSNSQESRLGNAGLNLQLPEPKLADESRDSKLSFYDRAEEDSIKLRQEILNDPYYKGRTDSTEMTQRFTGIPLQSSYGNHLNPSPYYPPGANDVSEARIYERLDALNKVIAQPATPTIKAETTLPGSLHAPSENDFSAEVDRLQNMMQVMGDSEGEDPEMKQIAGVLDKIMDIQHPEREKDRVKEKSLKYKQVVFAVNKKATESLVGLLDTNHRKNIKGIGFYTTHNYNAPSYDANTIEAELPQDQLLVDGAIIKLRLTNDVYINGFLIPKNTQVSGVVNLNDERLNIEVASIRLNNNLFPVKLQVYDLDGLPGIYIPGAITRDISKQSGDDALQLMELTSVDPSFKAQAATAGINTVKSLLRKKVKQIKVMVKTGYKVLLRDKNIQQ